MKRKKSLTFHIGGTMGADISVTMNGSYGRAFTRDESKDHFDKLASAIVSGISEYTLTPIIRIKVR